MKKLIFNFILAFYFFHSQLSIPAGLQWLADQYHGAIEIMKKLIFAFILFLSFILYPFAFSWAAVAFGGCSTATDNDGDNSLTVPSVATSGSDVLLVASVAFRAVSTPGTSGVTWAGAAMTPRSDIAVGGPQSLSLWTRPLGNSPGTQNVVFTFNDNVANAVGAVCWFTGVDQGTPVGSVVTGTDYVGAPISITVPANGLGYDVAADYNQTPDPILAQTVGGGQTKRFDAQFNSGTGNNTAHFGSTRAATGSFVWTSPGGEYELQIGVPINASTGAPAATPRRRLVVVQ